MNLYARIAELADRGCRFCAAVVLAAEGSTPRGAGTRAVLDETGRILGTVGGGVVEAETQRRAIEVCRSGEACVFGVELSGEAAADCGAICGGRVRLLLDPTAAKDRAAYAEAAAAQSERRRGVLLTALRRGAATDTQVTWLAETGFLDATTTPAPADPAVVPGCLREGRPRLVPAAETAPATSTEVFVEPVIPNPLLVIAGGGHVGQALAAQALLVGFDVTVVDDRPEFAARELFPDGVQTHCGDIGALVGEHARGNDAYVVIVTRGHQHDAEALKACIGQPVAYIGMIGSRRKVALIRESFVAAGLATAEQFDAVHAPIGLDIGAETVSEIVASIVAELIAVRRKVRDRPSLGLGSRV